MRLVLSAKSATVARMSDFDSIRPYNDTEVPEVVARILAHPDLPRAAAKFILPGWLQRNALGFALSRFVLRLRTANLTTVDECQELISKYFARLIDTTTHRMTVSGLEQLTPRQPYLFIANHRDIVLDSGILNFFLHQAGIATSRMAVGDNLLSNQLAADLMRLNKSFIVERGSSGTKAQYRALSNTSQYIAHSLQNGVSVWIAQKEGRAKDGIDRTDPALIKMLALAYREAGQAIQALVDTAHIIPVAVSYEIDPCAVAKAHELCVLANQGFYEKAEEEDVQSIITGLLGQKGRVHLHIGSRVRGSFDEPDQLAHAVDQGIVGGLQVFPTHNRGAVEMGEVPFSIDLDTNPAANTLFEQGLQCCSQKERQYYLEQYANLVRNKRTVNEPQANQSTIA